MSFLGLYIIWFQQIACIANCLIINKTLITVMACLLKRYPFHSMLFIGWNCGLLWNHLAKYMNTKVPQNVYCRFSNSWSGLLAHFSWNHVTTAILDCWPIQRHGTTFWKVVLLSQMFRAMWVSSILIICEVGVVMFSIGLWITEVLLIV